MALNPIQVENALPGDSNGLVPDSAVGQAIEGYASEVSALPGDTLHFHVSTNPAASYQIRVYRLGWYGGAGARLIGCTPDCATFERGQPQPAPAPDPTTGLVQAGWPVTDTFVLPRSATSGYYRVLFMLANGQVADTFVIVRPPPSYNSAILVQVPVNTWQAYNSWGGRSLYNLGATASSSNFVSFDRPYAFSAIGSQDPLGWEYPMVLFLEQSGYDVSYQTDYDTDQDPSSLLGHRLVIDLGHDEYWTQTMRDAFQTARDAGVNLAFFGANDVYWRVRYQDGGRTIVDYKSGGDPENDPTQETGLFRVVDAEECQLIGIQHQGGEVNWPPSDYDVNPAALSNPWFAGTGFTASSVLYGLVSTESDTIPTWDNGASCGHALTIFFQHNGGGDELGNADATAYTAPSGAVVFAAGSLQFGWGLADPPAISGRDHGLVDRRLQLFVRNMLDDLSAWNVADLDVALSVKKANFSVGKRLELRVLIGNRGPDRASVMTLNLKLPPDLTFVRVASTAVKCTIRPLQCELAELPSGASAKAVFTLRPTAAGTDTLSAHAFSLISRESDPASAIGTVTIRVG